MSQTLLEMAKELVVVVIRMHGLLSDEANILLRDTYLTLVRLHRAETSLSAEAPLRGPASWQRSIARDWVRCLECGETFRQLSGRHLRRHDLTAGSYRLKYDIPSTQSLSARVVSARRREIVQGIRPWEFATRKRAADKR